MPVVPATQEAEAGELLEPRRRRLQDQDPHHPGQHGETPVSTKTTKISWAWWCVPVVPATREAEAGELLEPQRWRLQ